MILEYVEQGRVELLDTLEKEVPPTAELSLPPKSTKVRKSATAAEKPAGKTPSIPVGLLLDIDADYRAKALAGTLKRIAPRRLNPERKAWLPLMIKEQGGWRFTVMYSNTARAHELEKTNDWVVVYFERGQGESQCTIVTETRGPLKGKRVIRGREKDCASFYSSHSE